MSRNIQPGKAPSEEIPEWFGKLLDLNAPPRTYKQAFELYKKRCRPRPAAEDDADGQKEDARVVVATLELMLRSMEMGGSRMVALITRWTLNRKLGAGCPPELVPMLPRESGVYNTQITGATPDERLVLARYDWYLDKFIAESHPSLALLARHLEVCYALGLAGFESQFTRRLLRTLRGMSYDQVRAVIEMPTKFRFETPQIEAMTIESSAAAADNTEPVAADAGEAGEIDPFIKALNDLKLQTAGAEDKQAPSARTK